MKGLVRIFTNVLIKDIYFSSLGLTHVMATMSLIIMLKINPSFSHLGLHHRQQGVRHLKEYVILEQNDRQWNRWT